jgi:hypothetical protein
MTRFALSLCLNYSLSNLIRISITWGITPMLFLWATLCCLLMGHDSPTLLSNFQPKTAPAPPSLAAEHLDVVMGPSLSPGGNLVVLEASVDPPVDVLASSDLSPLYESPAMPHLPTLLWHHPAIPNPTVRCTPARENLLLVYSHRHRGPGVQPRKTHALQYLWRWHHKTASVQRSPSLLARSCGAQDQ